MFAALVVSGCASIRRKIRPSVPVDGDVGSVSELVFQTTAPPVTAVLASPRDTRVPTRCTAAPRRPRRRPGCGPAIASRSTFGTHSPWVWHAQPRPTWSTQEQWYATWLIYFAAHDRAVPQYLFPLLKNSNVGTCRPSWLYFPFIERRSICRRYRRQGRRGMWQFIPGTVLEAIL